MAVAAGSAAGTPAHAAAPAPATPAPATPVLVAHYTFDAAISTGRVAELSGRGTAATIRTTDRGVLVQGTVGTGRFIGFPARCAAKAPVCPRALLEAPDDADLNPGLRRFRWAAAIRVLPTQLTDSSNILQKGLANTESQWKMQIGPNHGKVQCVVTGPGSPRSYIARSSATVADGKWHRIICERSGGSLAVAVDGVVSNRVAVPAGLSISNKRPLRIGGPNFSNSSDLYHGWLDDVYAALG
ncbi:laminin G domain-containing protein [Micromonosporaceae bacterium Da 78-11]